ncbi:hypothetical protein VPNG_03034 [Cytospora leucostoma]|uniref:Uncharacterized protein n=1 Tax=Cytospora leucostoma TaxID=1230097 RepID=A0A423XG37_9PEZI|nr:hypothetical protein VPNG_03034 [Cytospora leucostoma]
MDHVFTLTKPRIGPVLDFNGQEKIPNLLRLDMILERRNLGGFDACAEFLDHIDKERRQYLDVIGDRIALFRESGKDAKDATKKRKRFLDRIHEARTHLEAVFGPDRSEPDLTEEHKHQRAQNAPLVNTDICQLLSNTKGFQLGLLADKEGLRHLKPKLVEDTVRTAYTHMESLDQLLGDDIATSNLLLNYDPREKLILCYILASSMLFFYPGSWLQKAWDSSKIYFIRHVGSSTSALLTFPYLSADIQEAGRLPKLHPEFLQSHQYPAILALGIMFLEIGTGSKFDRSCEHLEYARNNTDLLRAWKQYHDLKNSKARGKPIPPSLIETIYSCLKLSPPPDSAGKSWSEGSIRHYILTRIIRPLAKALEDGYKIDLKGLNHLLVPENDMVGSTCNSPGLAGTSRASCEATEVASSKPSANPADKGEPSQAGIDQRCHHRIEIPERPRQRKMPEEDAKIKSYNDWFRLHEAALTRIQTLRKPDGLPVKIAILDSGIHLSDYHKRMYDKDPPKILYQSWIDEPTKQEDDKGHGTHLATLLRRIAPCAVIHVARVYKHHPDDQTSRGNIAKAIRFAVDDWEVDIIVMSFGFADEDEGIYQAIKHAAHKDVLMFAAASNAGKNEGVAWPARDAHVICVHSGDEFGNPSAFTPETQENMKIMVLGESVLSAWPHEPSPNNFKTLSGTSCAAPIAAGIAAVMLDYSRGFLSENEWKAFRRLGSMRRMFEQLKGTSSTASGYWWIKHWHLFDADKEQAWIEGEIRRFLTL